MENYKKIIASRIREIRKDNELTLEELGTIIGVTGATVSRYESGNVDNIPVSRIRTLAQKFGLNAAWILDLSDKKYLNGKEK